MDTLAYFKEQQSELRRDRARGWKREKREVRLLSGRSVVVPLWLAEEPMRLAKHAAALARLTQQDPRINTTANMNNANVNNVNNNNNNNTTNVVACSFPGCTRAFQDEASMKRHHTLAHSQRLEFLCNMNGCRRRFADEEKLLRHRAAVHLKHNNNNNLNHPPASNKKKSNVPLSLSSSSSSSSSLATSPAESNTQTPVVSRPQSPQLQ